MISTRPNGTSFIAVARQPNEMRVAITCCKCQRQEVGSDKPQAPFHLLIKHFKERGWTMTQRGTHAVCRDCQRRVVVSPPVLSDHDADVAFARQREAEERRQAAAAKQQATTEAAAAFSAPAAPRTIADVIKDCEAIVDEMPTRPHRGAIVKHWIGSPKLVARLAAEYIRADELDRARIVRALTQKAPALQSGLLQFARGLNSNGAAPWPQMQVELRALGVEPLAKGDVGIRRYKSATGKAVSESNGDREDVVTTTKDELSREARRAQAKMYSLLEAHFTVPDGSNVGAYDDGWSDEKVAAESGMSAEEVARTREQVYGVVADPRIAEFEAKIEEVRREFVREADDIKAMLALLRQQAEGRIAGLSQALAAIKGRR